MKKVLVVDDDAALREVIGVVFAEAGLVVRNAGDGVSAIADFLSHQPDAVVMGHNMPYLHGLDALKKMKEIAPDVPVVMMSGHRGEIAARAMQAGAAGVVRKPCDIVRLAGAVNRLIDHSSAAKQQGRT